MKQGVLHNPRSDRRTTQGIFHIVEGGLPIPGIVHIPQPYWFGEGGDMSPDEFGIWAAKQLEKKIEELGENKVAAFIAEPIQGAGGVIIPPKTYWPEIKRICAKYDILLIADEVICGFGRTGNHFLLGVMARREILEGLPHECAPLRVVHEARVRPLRRVQVAERRLKSPTSEGQRGLHAGEGAFRAHVVVELRQNGQTKQNSDISQLIHGVPEIIAHLSTYYHLQPGDVIFTGTCSGVGAAFNPPKFLRAGDIVRVEIERLGAIVAHCVDEAPQA